MYLYPNISLDPLAIVCGVNPCLQELSLYSVQSGPRKQAHELLKTRVHPTNNSKWVKTDVWIQTHMASYIHIGVTYFMHNHSILFITLFYYTITSNAYLWLWLCSYQCMTCHSLDCCWVNHLMLTPWRWRDVTAKTCRSNTWEEPVCSSWHNKKRNCKRLHGKCIILSIQNFYEWCASEQPWGQSSLPYNGYWIISGGEAAMAWHKPPNPPIAPRLQKD
jgi:hypothetical protein